MEDVRPRQRLIALAVATALVVLAAVTMVQAERDNKPEAAGTPRASTTRMPAATTQPLVAWTGPVEHLFFHTLVIRPELAFTHDLLAERLRSYFVTVDEFRSILNQMYANGWTLVDIHRVAQGTVRVPPGRRPFVLSEDDANYYDDTRPRGLGWRLVVDGGRVRVEERDKNGTHITDDDLIPIVDAFISAHPDFSADGAKGIIAVTGYQGVFGERTNERSAADHADRVERATKIAERLRKMGWIFASHGYGHLDITTRSTTTILQDTQRWKTEVGPIVGPTDIYIYPYGATPRPGAAVLLGIRDAGFQIQCDIDSLARIAAADGVTTMARRHIDGIAFDNAARLAPFFDVSAVEDKAARGG